MLGRIWVGANECQQEVGVVGARRPHLLAVDHEVVAVADRARAQRCQVRTGAGLAHPERRGDLGRAAPAPPSAASARRLPNEISDAATILTPCGLKLW